MKLWESLSFRLRFCLLLILGLLLGFTRTLVIPEEMKEFNVMNVLNSVTLLGMFCVSWAMGSEFRKRYP
jgi:hypothetical protein